MVGWLYIVRLRHWPPHHLHGMECPRGGVREAPDYPGVDHGADDQSRALGFEHLHHMGSGRPLLRRGGQWNFTGAL